MENEFTLELNFINSFKPAIEFYEFLPLKIFLKKASVPQTFWCSMA